MHTQPSMMNRRLRRVFLVSLFLGILYLLFTKGRAWRARPKHYAPGAIRSEIRELQEIGKVCRAHGGKTGLVHNRHAIVLDAGSTGSRVHVYEFQCCGDQLVMLADELFEEVKPGLSSFGKAPWEAAKSLAPLLAKALERVPAFLHGCTPLVLKATAGLRLLPEEDVKAILGSVMAWLQTHPFLLGSQQEPEKTPVSVMDGSEEAVLAWVTVNFLNKQIGAQADIDLAETSVVMDLGGGSTQIVFAVPDRARGQLSPLDHPEFYYALQFHGHTHHLYQHSYLGFGLMEARKAVKRWFLQNRPSAGHKFACFPAGTRETIDGANLDGDSGGFDRCMASVRGVFDKQKHCELEPCSFNGIHQPAFPPHKGRSPKFVIFSYFYDRLIPLGLSSPLTLRQVKEKAGELCAASPKGAGGMSRLLGENHEWCLDVAYIYGLLSYGYQIDLDTPITVTKQIAGYEAGWALGSALKLLEQHSNSCPVPPPFPFN